MDQIKTRQPSRSTFAYEQLPADDGYPMLRITYGPIGWQMMAGFHRGVAEMVRVGNSAIIDEMLLDETCPRRLA